MAYTTRNRTGRINGFSISDMSLSQPMNYAEVMTFDSLSPVMIFGNHNHSLDVTLYADAFFNCDDFRIGEPLIGLGEGFICQHCQTYTPRGKYLCLNCSAPLVKKELIRPFRFPFVITGITTSVSFTDFGTIDLSMQSIGDVDSDFVMALTSGSFHLSRTQEYINVTSGLYLCQYCGTATRGDRCEACDAGRLPFHELVDMQHECVYCGSQTVNGIVCDSCGARMSGTTLHERMSIDYLSPFYDSSNATTRAEHDTQD